MRRKLDLDISVPESLALLKKHAPNNDMEGLKQSLVQSFKIPKPGLPKQEKRIRFTGEREFVVEYAYGLYALAGQVDSVSGASTIYLRSQNTTAITIMKWGPIALLTSILAALILMPGRIFNESISFWAYVLIISALGVWAVVMYGFYYLIKVIGGRRAEKDLYEYIYTILRPHLV